MVTKQMVANGFGLVALFWLAVVVGFYVRFVIDLFRRKEQTLGVLFGLLLVFVGGGWCIGVPTAMAVGWAKARRWGIRRRMVAWSASLAIGVTCLAVGLLVAKTNREYWQQQWDSVFGHALGGE